MRALRTAAWAAAWLAASACAQSVVTFNDDGGWCWFEDERVLVVGGKLLIGSVAMGVRDPERKGDIEAVVYGLADGSKKLVTLHRGATPAERKRWADDHNSPAFLLRPDGRVLAMYSQHGPESKIYYRITERAGDLTEWGEERVFEPSPASRVTYSNLHYLSAENPPQGRIYDFFRGYGGTIKPSYAWSDDLGETWTAGGIYIEVPTQFRHRPYVKYASNGRDTVHIAYTDGHPRNFDNSVYHIFYRGGQLHKSGGERICALTEGLKTPEQGTRIFQGDPNNVGWTSDLHLDKKGHPYLAYSVQKDSAGLPPGQGGEDHRYRYARWDGKRWLDSEIAYAGSKLYPREDDYTGNIALDPQDPDTVYISTNADPARGTPLVSRADNQRHWEIFRGRRKGAGWQWTPVTKDSTADNIRPILPIWKDRRYALLWLRGKMRTYSDYDFDVVGIVARR